ncbi:2'-5' RNA ligase family protein [Streptomyces sp. NPDC091209]|uniref:2'-5' RNA ligase family protein n=1 Tax=Streptomyces sp. NPDC091209 TaxID=3365974 RepID=UPI0038185A19
MEVFMSKLFPYSTSRLTSRKHARAPGRTAPWRRCDGAATAGTPVFAARLDGVRTFRRGAYPALSLDPAVPGKAPWEDLHHVLQQRFPLCRGSARNFAPHPSLGRAGDPRRVSTDCATRLDA